ncbi:SulP family inorganic anion transporter [Burkholderiaceae bacterium FT117]|uniref:SulP family inorganic anion transporter n=1 Tax=Zeimonas sediminis TaxID=2944268 RepID=UPI002342C8CC|nr:SulP family inorganic anion transporter [Zeimonas sediminis]MCM5572144.1 SulP family inorganic anion transporter [Zeimonas sediminis]
MSRRLLLARLFPPLRWWHLVDRSSLPRDLVAGAIGALIVLPQGIAFATLAGVAPEYGLYAAMVPTVVAALFGSSLHTVSGPTNAVSIMTFAALASLAVPGSPEYLRLAFTLAFLMGSFMLLLGLLRLGTLVNFISQPVIVGFMAGAGLLIVVSQLPALLGLPAEPGGGIAGALAQVAAQAAQIEPGALTVAAVTVAAGLGCRRWRPRWPHIVVAMLAGTAAAAAFDALARVSDGDSGLRYLDAIPRGLPPLSWPLHDLASLGELFGLAVALSIVALTQSVSIARAVALRSGQRIDGNQEFIGQGLSNIAAGFFSGLPVSASVNRSGPNFEAGAVTPLAAVFSALVLAAIVVAFAPAVRWLPQPAIAAVLLLAAISLIDVRRIRQTMAASRSEGGVLLLTLAATLVLRLDVAVLSGVAASLVFYLNRTSRPVMRSQVPDVRDPARTFVPLDKDRQECPQLKMLTIEGSIYFGAVDHVATHLDILREISPDQKHLLLLARNMNFVDVAGASLLAQEAARRRAGGGRLYLHGLRQNAESLMRRAGLLEAIGEENLFPTKDQAIAAIYERLDRQVCARCSARIFYECQAAAQAVRDEREREERDERDERGEASPNGG